MLSFALRSWTSAIAILALLGGFAGIATAQPVVIGDPYGRIVNTTVSPYWGYAYNPYGSYLHGAADLTRAQGDFLIKKQESFLLREKVRQEKLVTRRAQFEHWDWERNFVLAANGRYREQVRLANVERSRNNPPSIEIYTANPLNFLYDELAKRPALPIAGSTAINPDMLTHINITVDGNGNVGLLKGEKIFWPGLFFLPEFADERKELDQLLARCKEEAVLSTGSRRADPAALHELQRALDACQAHVRKVTRLGKGDSDHSVSDLIEARRHLKQLDDAIAVFKKPDAAFYLNSLQGKCVAELVANMKKEGVRFAPATRGCERFYSILWHALKDELTRIDGGK